MKKPTKGLSTKKAIMAGAALISLSAGIAQKAEAATGTGAMSAVLLTPITISGTQLLHFGSFTIDNGGALGGAVTIDTVGGRTEAGGGDLTLVAGAGAQRAGAVSLTGGTGLTIDVSVAAGTATGTEDGVAIAGGHQLGLIATPTSTATTMVVGNFVFAAAGANTSAFVLNPTNSADFEVVLTAANAVFPLGGTVLVKNGNTPGTYTGSYDLVANYQ